MTFEKYLEEQFMELREVGGMPITKDNYESMSENWFENLYVQEVIDFAEKWGMEVYQQGYEKALAETNRV